MSRTRVIAALVAAVSIGLLVGAARGEAAPTKPKVAWSNCFSGFGSFQCGTVQVPLDYDDPAGATISLALVRLPATDPAHRIGSLFLNPGGPGGSGVDFTLFAGPFLYDDDVRARFDLVGFDPRGTNRSATLRCFGTDRQWGPILTPFPFPFTSEDEAIWITAEHAFDDACARRGARIIDHMSTANVARDLDVLREAVGDARLTYAGYSYGSYLGTTYANMFPARVRALIVDGVLDPIAWSTGVGNQAETLPFSTRLMSDVGAQATLEEFFRLCDAGGDNCAFAPDSKTRFAALADRLKQSPVEITFPDGSTELVRYANLIGFALNAMYSSFEWPDFAQGLADLEAQANAVQLGARFAPFRHQPAYIAPRGFPHYPNFFEGFSGVACSDSDNPNDYAAWSAAAPAADAAHGYFGRIWTWASSVCADFPAADGDRYMGPFDHATANPVLVVGNLFDPATPYHGAQRVHALLPNSALLTVHGWGHTSPFLSQCADALASRYLVDLAVPPAGTVCDQDVVPFAN